MRSRRLEFLGSAIISTALLNGSASPPARPQSSQVSAVAVSLRDGSHDFDFLIGNWKAHVRLLRDRLNGPNDWVKYKGISNHKKLVDSHANFEEFEAYSDQLHKRNKGQALRLYNPDTHQWSIYQLDLDKGTLDLPSVVGQFSENRGEF